MQILHRHVDLEDDDGLPRIAVIDAGGQNRERFEDHAMLPSWSPDGGQIAFVSGRDGGAEIYVIGADGQGLERGDARFIGRTEPLVFSRRTTDCILFHARRIPSNLCDWGGW